MAKTNRIKNKQIKGAIDWLISSGLILKIPIVNTARIPFSAYTTENRFKLCLFDCGILGALSHLSPASILKYDYGSYNEHRKSQRSSASKKMSHKFVGQVEKIFQNLPKPLEWRSFFNHDLSLLTDICDEIKEISDKYASSIFEGCATLFCRFLLKLFEIIGFSKCRFEEIEIHNQSHPF